MRAFGASVFLATLACARAPVDLDSDQFAVINGEDDRLQAFEVPIEVREPLLGASGALIFSQHLLQDDDGSVSLHAPTASEALGLCADEPFVSEPVAAFCSAVLIDDDLVATVAHCFGEDAESAAERCHSARIAFDYAFTASDTPIELRSDRVFACRKLVAMADEVAIVQLDRTVSPALSPRPIATVTAQVGDELIVASHGAGLPLKIELAAAVTEVAEESGTLTVAMDTFAGSSGGGLYNQDLELVGLVENGVADWEAVNGCTRAAQSDIPREVAVSAQRVTNVVCGAGWPSLRLCDTPPESADPSAVSSGGCSFGPGAGEPLPFACFALLLLLRCRRNPRRA